MAWGASKVQLLVQERLRAGSPRTGPSRSSTTGSGPADPDPEDYVLR